MFQVYKMGSKPKGLVLIVNVRKYVNDTLEERLGSEHDIKRLKETFEQIGYEIETVEDEMLTARVSSLLYSYLSVFHVLLHS